MPMEINLPSEWTSCGNQNILIKSLCSFSLHSTNINEKSSTWDTLVDNISSLTESTEQSQNISMETAFQVKISALRQMRHNVG
jgi:hypothetical protein